MVLSPILHCISEGPSNGSLGFFLCPTCCICRCWRTLCLLKVCSAPWFFIQATHCSWSHRLLCSLLDSSTQMRILPPTASGHLKSWGPAFCPLYAASLKLLHIARNIWLQKRLAWITANASSRFQIRGFWARTPSAVSYDYRPDHSGIGKG